MPTPIAGLHVAVLMGGLSPEREVSLISGRECAAPWSGWAPGSRRVDAGRDLAAVLSALKPDVCFNALHGEWGEDGCVQGVLETLGIPYTHSGVLASALAMDKAKAKAVLAAAGVKVPGGGLYDRFEAGARARHGAALCGQAQRRGIVRRASSACSRAPTRRRQSWPRRRLDLRRGGDGRALYRRAWSWRWR